MAKATKHTETREITTTEEVTTYALELSEAERDALVALLDTEGFEAEHISIFRAFYVNDDPAPIAVGDRVRVSADGDDVYPGRIGTVKMIDESDDRLPYLVDWEKHPGGDWVTAVESV